MLGKCAGAFGTHDHDIGIFCFCNIPDRIAEKTEIWNFFKCNICSGNFADKRFFLCHEFAGFFFHGIIQIVHEGRRVNPVEPVEHDVFIMFRGQGFHGVKNRIAGVFGEVCKDENFIHSLNVCFLFI